jgi:predicted secreted hydrolase
MSGARAASFLAAALVALAAEAAPPVRGDLPLNDPAAGGFAQALTVRPFEFPRDHGPHPEFRQEWWYFTGHLRATGGEEFGFELTFFRFALAPPAAGAPGDSAWRAREIYMAHFAVSDLAAQRFRYSQKLSRGALGLAGAGASPLRVWLDDWSLAGGAADASPWKLHAQGAGYTLDLELTAQGQPVLNGEAGLSRKADTAGDASYYYSLPRLAARGQLARDGRDFAVSGLAWCDREWGSGGLGARQAGWDWFALQLADGATLMFYALRQADGTRDAHSAGTYVDAAGQARALSAASVDIAVAEHWKNAQGVRYPAAWRVRIPELALDLNVRPQLADQELHTSPPYWEGAVSVTGTRAGAPAHGAGYVELVGYASAR